MLLASFSVLPGFTIPKEFHHNIIASRYSKLYSFTIIAFPYHGCGKWWFLGVLKKIHLYSSPNNIKMIKSCGMKLGGHIALIENKINV